MKLWQKMLIGMLGGTLLGVLLGPKAIALKPIGTVFLNLLNMVVVLLVFSSMASGVTAISDRKKLGRIGLRTLAIYGITTSLAIVIGMTFAKLFNPGRGIGLIAPDVPSNLDGTPEILHLLLNLIPSNPIRALANGEILQVIVFALFLGLGLNAIGERAKPLVQVLETLAEVMVRITGMIMKLAPYGICAIMAWVSGTFGVGILYPLLKLLSAHYLACMVHVGVVFCGILLLARLPLIPFFKGMTEAITLAASTTSSSAALPATLHCLEANLGVPKTIARFVVPLGISVNMNGTAIFQSIAALFVAQAYGIELGIQGLFLIAVSATLASIGCAGIPGGAIVTLSIVFSSVGLPLEGIAIIAGIDRIRDIIGTVVNILGDAVVAVFVAHKEKELNEPLYRSETYHSYEEALVQEKKA